MTIKAAAVKLVLLVGLAISSLAHAEKMYSINIAIQSMPEALTQLSTQTDIQVIFPYQLAKDKTANAVKGRFSVEHALALLLQGTGLSGGLSKKNVLMISPLGDGSSNDYFNGEDMMNRKKNILASTIAFFVGVGGQSVVAQNVGSEGAASQSRIDEIIVTAQKRETSLQDTAMAISVVSGETIDKRGLVGMDDYLRGLPGVSMQEYGAGQSSIIIRGITGDPQQQAGLAGAYFGETSLAGFQSASTVNNAGNIEIKLVDIAQIELLRGPQGTLYGSDSMTGTLRTMPVAPNLNEVEGKLATRYSQTGEEGGNNTMVQAVLNVPLIEDALAVRGVVYKFDNSGYVKNVVVSQPFPGLTNTQAFGGVAADRDDVGSDEYAGFRLAALWQPTEELDITLTYLEQDIEQEGTPEIGLNLEGDYQQRQYNTGVAGSSFPLLENEVDITSLVVNYDLGWGKVTSASSWVDYTSRVETDLTFFSALLGLGDRPYGSHNIMGTDAFTEEVRLVSDLEGPVQFIAGLYYSDKEFVQDLQHSWTGAADQDPGVFLQHTTGGESLEQKAAFGEISYVITDQLTATVGGRHYEYERDHDSLYRFTTVFTSHAVTNTTETGQLYKVNLSYTPNEESLLYAQRSEGFRPGRKIVGGNPACDAIGFTLPDQIDSDTTTNMELGFKSSFADNRITLNAALYRIDWEDIPVGVNMGSGCIPELNAGKARSEGIEIEIQAQFIENLRTDLSLSYGEAFFVGDSEVANDGDNLPGSSDFNASVGLQYDFDLFDRNSFARLDYTYVSDYFSTIEASESDFTPTPAGGFGQFNLKAGIEFDDITLDVFVDNLTNDDGLTWVEIFSAEVGGDKNAYRIRPRTIGLNLAYRF